MWQRGRQNSEGNYYKLALIPGWLSKLLKIDLYLLRFDSNCIIPPHTDSAPNGYLHWRWNMMIFGSGVLTLCHETMSIPLVMKPLDNNWFLASLWKHDFVAGKRGCVMLSFGKLRRIK